MPDLIDTTEMENVEVADATVDPADTQTLEVDPVEATEVETAPGADVLEPEAPVHSEDVPEVEVAAVEPDEASPDAEVVAEMEPAAVVEPTSEAEPGDEAEPGEPVEAARPPSPYDMPGDWYVIHSYSGYENKVKANLETRIQSMHMGDRIFEVHIPMEDVVEFKAGKKVTVPKKVFPGYILVRMILDDDSWYAVRNTPGVTGFVAGNAQKPTPLSRREVERFLGVQEEEEKAKPRFKPEWEVGEQVRVVTGPFADFNGVIEDMNVDQQKVTVLVNIFGRDTPVELGFEDIQKS
jgi:transcriptional antiterminator NusG